MRYLLCDCDNLDVILFTLKQKGYSFVKRSGYFGGLLNDSKILIDLKQKVYYILQDDCEVELITNGDKAYLFNSGNNILRQLGVPRDMEAQAKALYEEVSRRLKDKISQLFDLTTGSKKEDTEKSPYATILDQFERFCKEDEDHIEKEERSDSKNDFKAALLPGRIVELEIKGERRLGFILTSGTIVYTNDQGEIKGYLNGFTMDYPYKIQRILIPTTNCFQLKDYKKMQVAWSRPIETVTIKKSVSEIEKELGLAPGTLEIC